MATRLTNKMRGLLLADPRTIVPDNLATNDGSASGSNYTEAGPRPGSATTTDATARLVPEITGGQSVDAKVSVMRGGNPGRDGCRVLWKKDSEADSAYRGWNHPCFMSAWSNVVISSAPSYIMDLSVTTDGTPVAIYLETTTGILYSSTWNWTTSTWGAGIEADRSIGPNHITGMISDDSGFLYTLLYGDIAAAVSIARSSDAGATWTGVDTSEVDLSATGITRFRGASDSSGAVLLMHSTSGAGEYQQWLSVDGVASFSLVETGTLGHTWSVFKMPSGFGYVYIDGATANPTFRRTGSAAQPVSEASAVTIEAVTLKSLVGYSDYDGTLFVIGRRSTVGLLDAIEVWYSKDLGETWTKYMRDKTTSLTSLLFSSGSDTEYINPEACVPARGFGVMLSKFVAPTSGYNGSIGAAWLGGWSNVIGERAAGAANESVSFTPAVDDQRMMAWGWDSSSNGRTWVPTTLPSNVGWGIYPGTGTATLPITGNLNILGRIGYTLSVSSTLKSAASSIIDVKVINGGSTVNPNIYHTLDILNNPNRVSVSIYLSTTGFAVRDDVSGSIIGSITRSMTSFTQIAMSVVRSTIPNTARVDTWYKASGETAWTAGPSGALSIGSTTVTAVRIDFSQDLTAAATDESEWGSVFYRTVDRSTTHEQQRLVSLGVQNIGRDINSSSYLMPGLDSSGSPAALRLVSGPGRTGEVYGMPTSHDYPIEAIFPTVEPSTKVKWRSTDKSEQIIALDLTSDTSLGGYTIALCLQGTNFASAVLEGYNGAAWVNIGSYDATEDFGAIDLTYKLDGDILRPDETGAPEGARYLHQGELVGGYVDLDGTSAREVVHNRAGLWSANTTATATIRLSGIDGTETAAGDATFVWPGGVLIVHLDKDTHYSRFRLRIPASQLTPWSYYQIGTMVLGYVVAWGKQYGDGWKRTPHRTADSEISRRGTRRITQRGKLTEDWSMSWSNMIDLRQLRTTSDLDYLGPSAANKAPIVARDDVWWLLDGVLREIQSGEYPVVALADIPETDVMITDPTMYLYGTTDSAPETTSVTGDEGESEVVRIGTLLVRGQV